MECKYFVSYIFKSKSSIYSWGIGNAEVIRKNKIATFEDIKEITNQLEAREEIECVSIINYILLEESEDKQ